MVHEELPSYAPSSPFEFIQFLYVALGEAGATATSMSEISGEKI
jgi:hypothetical protein